MTRIRMVGSSNDPIVELPFATALDSKGRRLLESFVTVDDIAPHQILAREGDVGRDFVVVADGVLMLRKELLDGREQITAFRMAGDVVTLHRCDTPWPATVQALTRGKIYRIDWDELRRLSNRYQKLDRALLDLSGDEIAGLQDRLLTLGRKSIEEKVASFLLEFCRPTAAPSRWRREFDLPMRRPQIADYLGLTTESVSREFTRLKCERVIAMPRPSRVILLNRPALGALAGGAPNSIDMLTAAVTRIRS